MRNKLIKNFTIWEMDKLSTCLKKIDENQKGFAICLKDNGVVSGFISDGDIRRWLSKNEKSSLNASVIQVCNKDFSFIRKGEFLSEDSINELKLKFKYIPVLDEVGKINNILGLYDNQIILGDKVISNDSPCFFIAEIGNNHNGDIKLAKKLVDLAKESGADCAKFQLRDFNSLYAEGEKIENNSNNDLGSEYTIDLLKKYQMSKEEMQEILQYTKSKGLFPLCTPFDIESLEFLEKIDCDAYKVASADLINHDLIKRLCITGKPLIVSTGMSSEQEIKETTELISKINNQVVLLHCNSTYPAPYKDVNLNYLERLKSLSPSGIVGYSGHEIGIYSVIGAIAKGSKIIEKHFTIDKTMEGNDHKVSLLPSEFREMVKAGNIVQESLGSNYPRSLSQGEVLNREVLGKSLVASKNIQKGKKISSSDIIIRSPGKGLEPYKKNKLIGVVIPRDISKGDHFYESDLTGKIISGRNYEFKRPVGIPVRYHDANELINNSNLDLVEFHLSYKDMLLDPKDFLKEKYEMEFVVHAPELFPNDHILDLTSEDSSYVENSIKYANQVLDLTRELNKFFPQCTNPPVIFNIGGASDKSFHSKEKIQLLEDNFFKNFKKLNINNIDFIPQTMPPFPWHFGGQRFHNLMVEPNSIIKICKTLNLKVCLDISHSALACRFLNIDLKDFINEVSYYVRHLHIVDSKDIDGEGLQIGEGELDFNVISKILNKSCPSASFVPEIWQGHKNNGEGFWKALNYLEGLL